MLRSFRSRSPFSWPAKVTIKNLHIRSAWSPLFDEISRLVQRHASVDVKIGNSDRRRTITLAGAAFLIYLAIKSWGSHSTDDSAQNIQLPAAWLSGLSISFLNPKIFVFFTALFSQLIPEGASTFTLLGVATVAGLIDGTWYSFVSLLVGHIGLEKSLSRHKMLLNRASACLYLIIASYSLGNFKGLLV